VYQYILGGECTSTFISPYWLPATKFGEFR
jgi:hypothetical protein